MPMTEATQIAQIQKEMQKQTSSIPILSHFTQNHHKCLQFMFNAQYQVILQSFQFKHAAYLQKKLANSTKVQPTQQIMRKYQILSSRNHQKLSKLNSHIDRFLNRLQFEWTQKRTHFFHRYYFEKYIDNELSSYLESLERILLNEEKLIKSELHVIYAIDRAIKARQACLNEVRRFIGTLSGADIQDHLSICQQRIYYYQSRKQKLQYRIYGYKINKILDKKISRKVFTPTKFQHFGQLINHYRKLTLHVVELITKWKDYIYSLTFDHQKRKQQVDYYYENQNYLLRLINDNSFVSNSFLSEYFRFSIKNDPFLVMPLIKLENDQINETKRINGLEEKEVNSQQLNKINCLKKVLAPETQSDLIEILQKTQILTTEYQNNIKKKKTFDLRTIHKINNLDYDKSFKNLSKSQVKLNFKLKTDNNLTKSTVSSLKSSSLKLSKLSTQKQLKTVQSGQLLPLKRQNNQSFRKKTLMKLSDPDNKKDSIFSHQNSICGFINPQNNQNSINLSEKFSQPPKLINSHQLQFIKQQIKQKIKSQLKLTHNISHSGIFKQPQLASYIDSQVQKLISQSQQVYHVNNMTTKLSKDMSLTHMNPQNPIFVDTYSIEESELASHLKSLCEDESLLEYEGVQYSMEELMKGKEQNGDKRDLLENLPCLYFLKVKEKTLDSLSIKEKTISNIVFTVKYMQKPTEYPYRKKQQIQRTVQVLFMTIKSHNSHYLSKAIIKAVQFLFKYETANNVLFTFFYHEDVQLQKQKIIELKSILQKQNCSIFERVVYKSSKKQGKTTMNKFQSEQKQKVTEVKICFSRKQQTKKSLYETNENLQRLKSDPLSLNINMNGIFSAQKLNLTTSPTESQHKQILSIVNYDYLLTQILKNHVDSDTFRTIGQNELWQHRLRAVIENILMLRQKQKGQQTVPFLQLETFKTVSELNEARKLLQKPSWSNLSDIQQLKSTNQIKSMSLQFKISLPYLGRAFITSKGQSYFRFQIKEKIEVLNMQYRTCFKQKHQLQETYEQKIFLFECLEKKNIRIGLFDATKLNQFIEKENIKLQQSGKKQAPLTISDLINSLSFMNAQNQGRSMKFMYRQATFVGNMFIPMINPLGTENTSNQPNSNTLNPIQVPDLKSISKNQSNQFIIAESVLWNYDVCLENGIRYDWKKERNSLVFESSNLQIQLSNKKMGIIVFLIPEFIVMYAKII